MFFADYFQSFQDTIIYYISSERLYFSLSVDVKHVLIIFDLSFHFYFLNMDILVTINSAIWIFETCPQNILIIKNLTHSSLDHNVGYMYRKFQVSVYYNNIVSNEKLITCGVPQGSVCGPLLFLLYINDMASAMKNCKVSLYADDTVLYCSHNNVQIASGLIQQDLDLLNLWCKKIN